jgi:hypothetical protein
MAKCIYAKQRRESAIKARENAFVNARISEASEIRERIRDWQDLMRQFNATGRITRPEPYVKQA